MPLYSVHYSDVRERDHVVIGRAASPEAFLMHVRRAQEENGTGNRDGELFSHDPDLDDVKMIDVTDIDDGEVLVLWHQDYD